MTAEFERDLTAARRELDAARDELLGVVDGLADADLERARRGGWSVRRILEHVVQSERLYASLTSHLRDLPASAPSDHAPPGSVAEGKAALVASRAALLAALEGVDEDHFYALRTVSHEEYSILSLLENVANHDREHAAQVEATLTA